MLRSRVAIFWVMMFDSVLDTVMGFDEVKIHFPFSIKKEPACHLRCLLYYAHA